MKWKKQIKSVKDGGVPIEQNAGENEDGRDNGIPRREESSDNARLDYHDADDDHSDHSDRSDHSDQSDEDDVRGDEDDVRGDEDDDQKGFYDYDNNTQRHNSSIYGENGLRQ